MNPLKKLWNLFITLQLSLMWWLLTAVILFNYFGFLGLAWAFFIMYYARYAKREDLRKMKETANFIRDLGA